MLQELVVSPDESTFTGAARYKIPIKVPPGRSGIAPDLALTYNSFRKNGWVGVGWDLTLGSIRRSTKRGLDYDANDFVVVTKDSTFELTGRTDWCPQCFGAKVEESFTRYERDGDGWVATAKNGVKYCYGSTPASRQWRTDANGVDRIFQWYLDKVVDTVGNSMSATYATLGGEVYLLRIEYTGNDALGAAYKNFILFGREVRDDAPTSFLTHFAVKTSQRLKTITVYECAEGANRPVSRYDLAYAVSAGSRRSLLQTVTQYARDGQGTWQSLPPITFSWTRQNHVAAPADVWHQGDHISESAQWGFSWGVSQWSVDFNGDGKEAYVHINRAPYSIDYWETCLPNEVAPGCQGGGVNMYDAFQLADMNEDGKADMILTLHDPSNWAEGMPPPKSMVVKLANGTGGFGDEQVVGERSPSTAIVDFKVADVTGDGRPDVIYETWPSSIWVLANVKVGNGLQLSSTGQPWGSRLANYPSPFNFDIWCHPPVRNFVMADANGDGMADVVYEDEDRNMRVMLSTGSGFSEDRVWGQRSNIRYYCGAEFRMADVNGDGLADVVYTDVNRGVHVLFSNGNGFQPDRNLITCAWNMWSTDPADPMHSVNSFLMADLNGDGLDDFVYIDTTSNSVQVLFSTGSDFLSETNWGQPGHVGPMARTDVDGDGLPDLAFVARDAPGSGDLQTRLLINSPPGGGGESTFPDLLARVENGIGGSYTIKYKPSSTWRNDYLPYIVQTVSSIAVSDGFNTYTTVYSYDGGLHSNKEREFRGFRSVKQVLPDGSSATTLYKQDDIYKGLMERQTTKDQAGRVFTDVLNTLKYRNSGAAKFPYVYKKDKSIYDGALDPIVVTTIFSYDLYGNLLTKETTDPITGRTRTDGATYYRYLDNWILSLPKITYTFDPALSDGSAGAGPCDGGSRAQQSCYTYQPGTNLLTRKTYWLQGGVNPSVTYAYDDYGNLVLTTDPMHHPTSIEYDTQTQTYPATLTNAKGQETAKTYDYRFGKPASVTDPNSNRTSFAYDVFGRLEKMTGPNDEQSPQGTVSFAYLDFGTLAAQRVATYATAISGPAGSWIWKNTFFDGLGRTFKTVAQGPDGKEVTTLTQYNSRGWVAKKSLPFFAGTETPRYIEYTYDCLGRVTSQKNPDGTVVATSFDRGLKTVIDENGHRKDELRDTFENLREVTRFTGQSGVGRFAPYAVTRYDYDVLGSLIQVKDAATPPHVTTISYDTLSRRTAMDEPNMGLWTFGYDANGNLVSQTDARGVALSFQYDALNRITLKKDAGGAGPAYVIYTYDEPGFANSAGRLTTVLDGSGTVGKTTFEYDKMGRPTRAVKTVDDPAHPFATETAYDDLGRAISVTYPGGDVVTFDYDGVVLKKVNSPVPLTGDGKTAYAEFSGFNAMGQVGAVSYANNVVTTYAYDTRNNRLSSIRSVSPAIDPVKPFQSLTFSYDNAGNVTSVADGVAPGYSMTYQYDELNRLTLADRGLDPPQVYSYDPTGNILGGPAGDYTYGARPYAVTSVVGTGGTKSYGYDNNGNMTSRPGKEVEYDFANRVSSIQLDSGNITFTYDHQGRRVKKATTQPSHETIYIGKTFERTDGAETLHIFAGNMRIASKTPTGLSFYHTDHLGGTNFVTDMTGLKKEAIRYEPYGTLRHDNGTIKLPYKFTGQELDDESGLYYYVARYYDPDIGRFISADPILHAYHDPATFDRLPGHGYLPADPPLNKDKTGHFALKNPAVLRTMDSLPGRVNSPDLGAFSEEKTWNKGKELAAVVDVVWVPGNTLNAYAYCSNNPVNLVDPLGLDNEGDDDTQGPSA